MFNFFVFISAYFGVSAGLLALSCISPEHKYLAVAILVLSLSLGGFFVSGFMVSNSSNTFKQFEFHTLRSKSLVQINDGMTILNV